MTANRSIDRHSLGEGGRGGEVGRNYLHAQDYMVYAHLQLSQDEEARAFMDDMIRGSDFKASVLGAHYALAALASALCGRAGRRTGNAIQRFV